MKFLSLLILSTLLYADTSLQKKLIALVIDKKGIIRYSFVDNDFRKRAEPVDIITILRQINNEK